MQPTIDMASLIPSLNNCVNRMQSGEKRFAWRIGSHLEDDYLCCTCLINHGATLNGERGKDE